MKNIFIYLVLGILVALGVWYYLKQTNPGMVNEFVQKYVPFQPTPTPTLPPAEDIDAETRQMEQELEQNSPDDFSGDALLDVNMGY